MYETFFRLQKRPFAATPDPACLFPTPGLVEGLGQLDRSVKAGQGIGLVVSPSGLGKTLLLRALGKNLLSRFTVVNLSAAGITSRRALLQGVLYELGERYSGLDEDECRLELRTSLRRMLRTGRGAVLLIDEADQLDTTQLAELRTWVDVADEGEPYLRLVLAGLPALEDRLVQPELSAFNERISTLVYLRTFSAEECRAYVEYRLAWAGASGGPLFTDDALDLVVKICDGLPRCLNQLCDHALLLAYVAESPIVDRKQVEEALGDLKQLPLHWNPGASLAPAEDAAVSAPPSEAVAHSDKDWTAEPREMETVWAEGGLASGSAFGPDHAAASFEVGAEAVDELDSTSVETVQSWESSEGMTESGSAAFAESGSGPVEFRTNAEFRTNVTPADLTPACEIDSEMESRLRDLLLARSTDPSFAEAPSFAEHVAEAAPETLASSQGLPPGEEWVLPPHTALPHSAGEEDAEVDDIVEEPEYETADDEYETEVVRDPWSSGADESHEAQPLSGGPDRDVVAEVSASRQEGFVRDDAGGFLVSTGDFAASVEPGREEPSEASDVLPFLAAQAGAVPTFPGDEEGNFTRRPQPDFVVEPVPDRYAALDDGQTELPPVEPTTGRDLKSLVEPVLTSLRRERDPRPDRAVDEILALVEEARRLDDPSTTQPPRRGEQTIVDGWGVVETGEEADTSGIEDETVLEGYDTVQPEPRSEFAPVRSTRDHLRDLADLPAETGTDSVPTHRKAVARSEGTESENSGDTFEWREATPSRYKRLFSLLRRKQRRAG